MAITYIQTVTQHIKDGERLQNMERNKQNQVSLEGSGGSHFCGGSKK